MKTKSVGFTFSVWALAVAAIAPFARAEEYEWTVDPRPYSERTTRLVEIAVHRYVPQGGGGAVLERKYLLTASGLLARSGDTPVPAAVTIPEKAYDKLLVRASSWLAYGQLGPQALANFELVNDLEPIDIAGRWHYEVRVAPGANGYKGAVPNLSTRAEVTPQGRVFGGFVITDMPRLVLVRAVGPGLAQFGVTNALPSVRLELFNYDTVIAANEDWAVNPSYRTQIESAAQKAGAFPLTPGTKDAAMAIILAPGTYTVQARGVTPVSGSVLLEVYLID